jgi:predicted acyl esterase
MKKMLFWVAILGAGLLMPGASAKADYEVMTRNDILFAEHDGVRLLGDFYAPKGVEKAPVLVAVHGGDGKWATASSIRTGDPISPRTASLCSQSNTG